MQRKKTPRERGVSFRVALARAYLRLPVLLLPLLLSSLADEPLWPDEPPLEP